MRIDVEEKNRLDKFLPEDPEKLYETADADGMLPEALDLLYDLLQGSFHAAGTALEAEINGQRETVQSLYWKAKELLDKTMAQPDKTGFLSMSVIEQTYRNAKPLLLARVEELLSGECRTPEQARRLEEIIATNPYKKIWAEKSGLYVKILERIGFSPDAADFSDLTRIMDPLLDALSFYGTGRNTHKIYKIRSGPRSESRNPEIARSVCRYSSKKDLVDAAMSCGRDCVILFGAVERTHRQVTDWFEEWYNGYADERQRNFIRNDGITREEYLDMGCDYTRCVYTCVKSGGTCWLVPMPYNHDTYARIGEEAHAYYYGRRSSYAPYEIFVKEPPRAPEGTTLLAVPRNGFLLSELMDPLSMAWFPAFMDETIRYFFRSDGEPASTDLLLCEEAVAEMPDGYKNPDKPADSAAIVPYVTGPPAVATYRYVIKAPEELDLEPWFTELLGQLNVTPKDITGVPILPVKDGDRGTYDTAMDVRMKQAYVKLAAERIAVIMKDRWNVRSWLVRQVVASAGDIIQKAGDGDLMAFMDVIIEGTPVLGPDGKQKMETSDHYPYRTKPAVQHTSMDDTREYSDITARFSPQVLWASSPTSGKPPVVWKLRPCAPEHYEALTGVEAESLPRMLRMSGLLTQFQAKYKDALRGDIMNEWLAKGYGEHDKKLTAYMPCMAPVNICMTKKVHAGFPYFKPAGRTKKNR